MPAEVVLFPDAAYVAISWLNERLPEYGSSATVTKDVPSPRPAGEFVTVRRGGGIRHTVVTDNALLLVECWAPTNAAAHDLAQLARGILHALPGNSVDGVPVYRVDDAGGPVDLPDPLSDQPRITFSVEMHVRGATSPQAS